MRRSTPGLLAVHFAQTVSVRPRNSDLLLARMFGARARAEANARLIAAAWNGCVVINPENPIAAAEAMPALLAACKAALAALNQNKTFPADIAAAKKWLGEAIALAEKKEAA